MMKQFLSATEAILSKPLNIVLFGLLVSVAGYVLQVIVPHEVSSGSDGAGAMLAPPSPLAMAGQEVYQQEGCQYCHTQNLRPLAWETARFANTETYGHYPIPGAAEYQFESPLLRGSKRIGPDLSRVAGSLDEAAVTALLKSKADGKSMRGDLHAYGHLFNQSEDLGPLFFYSWKVRAMTNGGALFTEPYQKSVFHELEDKTRGEALVQYLLSRGQKQANFAGSFYQK